MEGLQIFILAISNLLSSLMFFGSSIALESPDFSKYPRAECSKEYSQEVILHAGDALFIPEGW